MAAVFKRMSASASAPSPAASTITASSPAPAHPLVPSPAAATPALPTANAGAQLAPKPKSILKQSSKLPIASSALTGSSRQEAQSTAMASLPHGSISDPGIPELRATSHANASTTAGSAAQSASSRPAQVQEISMHETHSAEQSHQPPEDAIHLSSGLPEDAVSAAGVKSKGKQGLRRGFFGKPSQKVAPKTPNLIAASHSSKGDAATALPSIPSSRSAELDQHTASSSHAGSNTAASQQLPLSHEPRSIASADPRPPSTGPESKQEAEHDQHPDGEATSAESAFSGKVVERPMAAARPSPKSLQELVHDFQAGRLGPGKSPPVDQQPSGQPSSQNGGLMRQGKDDSAGRVMPKTSQVDQQSSGQHGVEIAQTDTPLRKAQQGLQGPSRQPVPVASQESLPPGSLASHEQPSLQQAGHDSAAAASEQAERPRVSRFKQRRAAGIQI